MPTVADGRGEEYQATMVLPDQDFPVQEKKHFIGKKNKPTGNMDNARTQLMPTMRDDNDMAQLATLQIPDQDVPFNPPKKAGKAGNIDNMKTQLMPTLAEGEEPHEAPA